MPIRLVPGQFPYSAGTGIAIDANKVISILLRAENNLINVNDDNEIYTDLQLADGIAPTDDFPVGVTVGKVLQTDGWTQNGLLLNWKTTSGDYARWLYGADGELYFDGGQGTWKQVYYSDEVDALFTALRADLATVAFTGDYNDLINRPAFLQVQADRNQNDNTQPDYINNKPTIPTVNDATLTIQKNGTPLGTFTANSSTNTTVNVTVPNVINNVQSTSTSDALSANQGKELQDQIDDLKAMGRFLSLWDATTGQPISFPLSTPYNYQTGDYYLVETVSSATPPVNYRPNGVQYTGTASTTPETDELEVGDLYIYDGTLWLLQINHGKTVSFANLAGQPSDNTALANALNSKADATDVNTKTFTILDTTDLVNAQASVDWIVAGKNAIIKYGGHLYVCVAFDSQHTADFECFEYDEYQDTSNSKIRTRHILLALNSSNQVTSISSDYSNIIGVLATDKNYSTAYTPLYDGSPATKKYVDDNKITKTSQLNNDSGFITSAYHDSSKQDTLTAGTGISITSNTVANTGVTSFNGSTGAVTYTAPVTSVNSNTGAVTVSEFSPGGTATTGYVVTKTANGYEWAAPTGGIAVDSASPIQLTKIWAGTQAQYEALGSYDATTVYLTI